MRGVEQEPYAVTLIKSARAWVLLCSGNAQRLCSYRWKVDAGLSVIHCLHLVRS